MCSSRLPIFHAKHAEVHLMLIIYSGFLELDRKVANNAMIKTSFEIDCSMPSTLRSLHGGERDASSLRSGQSAVLWQRSPCAENVPMDALKWTLSLCTSGTRLGIFRLPNDRIHVAVLAIGALYRLRNLRQLSFLFKLR